MSRIDDIVRERRRRQETEEDESSGTTSINTTSSSSRNSNRIDDIVANRPQRETYSFGTTTPQQSYTDDVLRETAADMTQYQARRKTTPAADMTQLQQGGNVDLYKRPVIDTSLLTGAGWDAGDNGKATVYSSTYSNAAGDMAYNFTPIVSDRNGHYLDVLSPERLEKYAQDVIDGKHDDYLRLQIGVPFTGTNAIGQATSAAEAIHRLQEQYYLGNDTSARARQFGSSGMTIVDNPADILKRADYAVNSKATGAKSGGVLTGGKLNAEGYLEGANGGDLRYDFINNLNNMREQVRLYQTTLDQDMQTDNEVRMGKADPYSVFTPYTYMNEDEIGIYNYLYSTEGKNSADNYLVSLTPELNSRERGIREESLRQFADERPAAASLYTTLMSPTKGLSYLGQVADYIDTGKIDQNATYNRFSYVPMAIRDQVSSNIESKWGKVGSFGYQLGMSMADSLVNMLPVIMTGGVAGAGSAATKAAETVMLAVMGSGAAADTVISLKDQGYDDDKSFILGTIAGIAEFVTERIGMDAFLTTLTGKLPEQTVKQFIAKELLRNAGAEGLEEGLSDVINWSADAIYAAVTGNPSDFKQLVNSYIEAGMSESEAFGKAIGDKVLELGLDIGGGALSGLIFGAGGIGVNLAGSALGRNGTIQTQLTPAAEEVVKSETGAVPESVAPAVRETTAEATTDEILRRVASGLDEVDEQQRAEKSAAETAVPRTATVENAPAETAEVSRETEREAPQVSTIASLGVEQNGQEAFEQAELPIEAAGAFTAYWNAGNNGTPIDSVKSSLAGDITDEVKQLAWNAGRADAIESGKAVADNTSAGYNNYTYNVVETGDGYAVEIRNEQTGNIEMMVPGFETEAEALETADGLMADYNRAQEARYNGQKQSGYDSGRQGGFGADLRSAGQRSEQLYAAPEETGAERRTAGVTSEAEQAGGRATEKRAKGQTHEVDARELTSSAAPDQRVIVHDSVDSEAAARTVALGKKNGVSFTRFDGDINMEGQGPTRGYCDNATGNMGVRDDDPNVAADDLGRHELMHRFVGLAKVSVANVLERAADYVEQWKIDAVKQAYNTAFGKYGEEELVCDGADHINQFRPLAEGGASGFAEMADIADDVLNAINRVANELTDNAFVLDEGAATTVTASTEASVGDPTAQMAEEDSARFSMRLPVEETKNLVALHNLSADKLTKALELGGFPMPSIAVTKTDIPHTNFGDITLVMDKSTIDPQADRRNTVYSADAWTPTFPSTEYETNEKVASKLRKKYYELYNKYGDEATRPLYPWANYADDQLNRVGGEAALIEREFDNVDMMKLYLMDQGTELPAPVSEERVERLDDATVAMYDHFINAMGADTFRELIRRGAENPMAARKAWWEAHGDDFDAAYMDYLTQLGFSEAEIDNVFENETLAVQTRKVLDIRNYLTNGREKRTTTTNIAATNEAIKALVDRDSYKAWLNSLFKGIEKSSGIYNGKDRYTPSGNIRSFAATHYPVTLDNIAKAMAAENNGNSRNVSGFYGVKSLRAGMAERFASIQAMHDKEGRLKHLSEQEAENINETLNKRLTDILGRIYDTNSHSKYDNAFIEMDRIGNILMEITEQKKITVDSIEKVFEKYQYKIGNELAVDIRNLLFDVSEMPVNIFEAKPERPVRFDEVLAAIVPSGTDQQLITALQDAGVQNVMEYEEGNDADRLEKVNSVEDARFSSRLTEVDKLIRQNEKLKQRVDYWRGQTKLTTEPTLRQEDVNRAANNLLKDYDSKAAKADVGTALKDLGEYMLRSDKDSNEYFSDVKEKATDIAREIVNNASVLTEGSDAGLYKEVKARLQKPMIISAQDAHDITPDDWGAWRNANRGKVNVSINGKGTPVDTVYDELSDAYPWLFPKTITHQADMVEQMIDAVNTLQPVFENPFSLDMAEAIEACANDVVERLTSGAVRETPPTFADRAQARLEAEKEKSREALRRVREKRDAKIAEIREHYANQTAKASENRKAGALRSKIMRHVKEMSAELLKPTDKHHIPQELRGPVARLLESINTESGFDLEYGPDAKYHRVERGSALGAEATKRTQAFAALKAAYAKIGGDLIIDPELLGDGAEPGLLDDAVSMGNKPLANMTSAELQTIWKAVRAVEASIRTWNKLFAIGRWETVTDLANSLKADNKGKRGKIELRSIPGRVQNLLSLDMLTPETYFSMLGNTGYSMFRALRDAQDQQIRLWDDAITKLGEATKDYDIRQAERKVLSIDIGGNKVDVTRAQLMELYVLLRREQALDHLRGGIQFSPVNKGIKKLHRAEALRNNSLEELAKATELLTPQEVRIAEAMQEYLSKTASGWGNKASMDVYGYEKFGEDNYWPIPVNRHDVLSTIEGETGQRSVKNYGFAKALTPNANNSVIIGSAFDTFANHVAEMATYSAYLKASEDLMRVFNYQFRDENGGRIGTVKEIVDKIHGTSGNRYFTNLMTQLAFGVKGENIGTEYMGGLVGNYKGSAIGANLRVFIQQPTAIVRAAEMINPAYLTAGLKNPVGGWKKAVKYAPIAQWKDWGYFDMAAGRSLKSLMFNTDSKLQKANSALMAPAGWMDSFAWGQLWNACEMETKAKIKSGELTGIEPGTSDFYKTVAARFEEIIDHTQVVDGILQRSQIMRAPDSLAKMATSFMAEPTKQYNEFVSAAYNVRNAQDKTTRSKAIKRLGRTVAALVVASALNAVARSLIDALRDDDRDKKYWERFFANLPKNLADEANPLSYIPFVRDISSLIQGYGVDRMDMETIGNVISAAKTLIKALNGNSTKTVGNAVATLIAEAARLLGVPASNIKRDLLGIANTIGVETGNWLFLYGMDKLLYSTNYTQRYYDTLYAAYKSGSDQYEELYNMMVSDGFDEDKIKSAMDSRIKKDQAENQDVEVTTQVDTHFLLPEQRAQYDSVYKDVQDSGMLSKVTDVQQQKMEKLLFGLASGSEASDAKSARKAIEDGAAVGLDETEYILYRLALSIVDKPNSKGQTGSADKEEKAGAARMVPGLSQAEREYLAGTSAKPWTQN